ncbi:putative aldo/keto reductase, NADP-dependent oxidoreductase domain superfamily [Helianthus anomalus]
MAVADALAAVLDEYPDTLQMGHRHIDCAQVYGNKKEIGLVLKKLFQENVVRCEDLWITSKLCCQPGGIFWDQIVIFGYLGVSDH